MPHRWHTGPCMVLVFISLCRTIMWVEPIYCHLRSTRSHQHLRVYVAFSVWWPNMFNKAGVSIDHCSNPSLELWGWFYCTQPAENVYHRGTPQLPLILFEQGWLKASSVDWSNPGKMVPAVIWAEVSYISFILLTIFFTIVIGMVLVFCSSWKSDSFPHETLPGHAMAPVLPGELAQALLAAAQEWAPPQLSSAVGVVPLSSVAFYHIVGIQPWSIRWLWGWTGMDNTSFPVSVAVTALHCKTYILN